MTVMELSAAVSVIVFGALIHYLLRTWHSRNRDLQAQLHAAIGEIERIDADVAAGRLDDAHALQERRRIVDSANRSPVEAPFFATMRINWVLAAVGAILAVITVPVMSGWPQAAKVVRQSSAVGAVAATPTDEKHDVSTSDGSIRALSSYLATVPETHSLASRDQSPIPALSDVETMIDRLAARLSKQPDDFEGWRMLGWSYFHTQRFSEAVSAYKRARALKQTGDITAALVAAIVKDAGETVTAVASELIAAGLRAEPDHSELLYFAGLAELGKGDKKAALSAWRKAASISDGRGNLLADLDAKVKALELEAGEADVSTTKRTQKEPEGARVPSPSVGQEGALRELSPQQRETMIAGMVDGLSEKLDQNPLDLEGWIRLMRSRMVLGQGAAAKIALAKSLAAFAHDSNSRDRILAAARELNVESN